MTITIAKSRFFTHLPVSFLTFRQFKQYLIFVNVISLLLSLFHYVVQYATTTTLGEVIYYTTLVSFLIFGFIYPYAFFESNLQDF